MTRQIPLLFWTACVTLLLALAPTVALGADTKPPQKMAFQGFLTDGTGAARGLAAPENLELTFRLFKSPTAAANTALWSEKQTVTVDKGHFSVVLGDGVLVSGTADFATHFSGNDTDAGRYLGVQVTGETEIAPRIQFFTAPYASLARYATELVGTGGTSVLKVGVDRVGINLPGAPSTALDVNGTVTATAFAGGGANLTGLDGGNLQNGTVSQAKLATDAVNSVKIADGSIVNADISAAAAIADTKLATISTAGKVSDTALSGNVARRDVANTFAANQRFNGTVGINKAASGFQLDVFGRIKLDAPPANAGLWLAENGTEKGFFGQMDANHMGWFGMGSGWSVVMNQNNGSFGIGTTTPTQAKLVISGASGAFGHSGGAIMGAGNIPFTGARGANPNDVSWSVYASGWIAANTFFAFSDERIKNVRGVSDGVADLATLQGIEITDFQYKDTVTKGDGISKKAIAQQVERVFPQAVHQTTDVVPDIYRRAVTKGGWVELATGLLPGDRVRLISDKTEGVYEVLEIGKDRFRTAFSPAEDSVFVYGREVKDFRTVDYEAIAMLNVSATQQLARQLKKQEAELAELRGELAKARGEKLSLAENLSAMDARLVRLEKVLRQQAALSPERAEAELVQVGNPKGSAALAK